MTKVNTVGMISSAPRSMTCKEAQILLKNGKHLTKTHRNLLIKNAANSSVDLNVSKTEIPEDYFKKLKRNGHEQKETKKTWKGSPCVPIVDLAFEEFQPEEIELYSGKPLKISAERIFVFDEEATKELNNISKISAKSNNRRDDLQAFPMHKSTSLPSRSFDGPRLPKRNSPAKSTDIPPVPPVRTTSKIQPNLPLNNPEKPTSKRKKRNVLRLQKSGTKAQKYPEGPKPSDDFRSLTRGSSCRRIESEEPPNVTFALNDTPIASAPGSVNVGHVQVGNEILQTIEQEKNEEEEEEDEGEKEATDRLMISAIFHPLSFHFNSLPRTQPKVVTNVQVGLSRSHQDLESVANGDRHVDSDSDEDFNHYEKISQTPEASASISQTNKAKILRTNELIVSDPDFFDFEISPKNGQAKNSNRLLSVLFHQYDLLEETAGAKTSDKLLTTACDREGNLYFIPKSALRDCDDVSEETWFYPLPLTMKQATCLLKDFNRSGSFVVYRSAVEKGAIHLSVRASDEIVHYRIERDQCTHYCVKGSSRKFPTLKDLVEFYKEHRDFLEVRLRAEMDVSSTFEVNRNEIKFSGEVLGVGHFGTICAAVYKKSQKVAVEVSREDIDFDSPAGENRFVEMVSILGPLDHPNIVKLIGVSCQTRPYYLISQCAQFESLSIFLKKSARLPTSSKLDICCQMSSALSYLAGKNFIVHRNIASSSFLLSDGLSVKLSSFHRARRVSRDVYISCPSDLIPVKWSPPEVLIDQIYTTKSDVWSLGVSMWQVFTRGDEPYNGTTVESSAILILSGEVLGRPKGCPKWIYDAMLLCWRLCPLDRPHASSLNRVFNACKTCCPDDDDDDAGHEYLEKDASPINTKPIPDHEAPAVGIVKMRQKFFSQRSTDGQAGNISNDDDCGIENGHREATLGGGTSRISSRRSTRNSLILAFEKIFSSSS